MDVSNSGDEKTECDSISALELQKTKRILYFSDGVLEELSESDEEDIGPDITDKNIDANIDFSDTSGDYKALTALIGGV
ncbi:uncharacterized protein ACRADG_009170 isoform 2-T2 [Cochliomyia hominivorax]